jgi:hypothetical protein
MTLPLIYGLFLSLEKGCAPPPLCQTLTSFTTSALLLLGAALIKKYSSYRTYPKKVPHVFLQKLVRGDLKSPPDGWQTLLPSLTILSISFSSNIAQYPPPLALNA